MSTYWFSDFSSLFKSININPFTGSDKNFKYNSLTRLIILVTIIGSIFFNENMNEILIAGIASIAISIIIYLITYNSQEANNVSESYEVSSKILEEQASNLKIDSTPISEAIIKDYNQNVKNQISIGYNPMDTDKLKHAMFLEGDKSTDISMRKYINPYPMPYGNQIETGTLKQFSGLNVKNIATA